MYRILAIEDPAVNIFLAALIIAASVMCIFLLIRSVHREKINHLESKGKNSFNGDTIKEFIEKRIETAGKNTVFTVIRVDIYDPDSLKQNFGELQFKSVRQELVDRLTLVMPEGTKFAHDDCGITLYQKSKYSLVQLEYLCKLILAESEKPFILVGTLKVDVDVNVSAASYPESGRTYGELWHNLELAMIVSKRKGINQFMIYDKELSNEETEEYRYYKEIKEAIDKKEFTLYYQPIINFNDMEAIGAESLLRWNHKTLGVLPPSKFLNIIEHSGDIYWVGLWAFEQLVKQSQQWAYKYPDRKLMLSLNLSPKQLVNPDLVNEFRRIIKKHKANASDFCMEIIEFAMFDKIETVQDNITKLRQMGFSIAIDNYGLEFSTLSLLDKLPIDIIKLDREFLSKTQENSMAINIVEMLSNYSKEHKIMVIAEGVENFESLKRIKELNITYGQGYYFSMPKAPQELINDILLTPWK